MSLGAKPLKWGTAGYPPLSVDSTNLETDFDPQVGRTCECGIHRYRDWSRNQSPADTIKRLCYLEYVFARVVDDRVPCASREQQPNGQGTDQEDPAPSGYQ